MGDREYRWCAVRRALKFLLVDKMANLKTMPRIWQLGRVRVGPCLLVFPVVQS